MKNSPPTKASRWIGFLFIDRVVTRFDAVWIGLSLLLLAWDQPGMALGVFMLGALASAVMTDGIAEAAMREVAAKRDGT